MLLERIKITLTFILVMAVFFFLYHTNCDMSVAIS